MSLLAAFVALVVTLVPPVSYGLLMWRRLEAQGHTVARLLARDLGDLAVRQPGLWRYNADKRVRASTRQLAQEDLGRVEVFACDQRTRYAELSLAPDALPRPSPRVWAPVQAGAQVVAWVRVDMNGERQRLVTLLFLLGSGVLGLALGGVIFWLPTRLVHGQADSLTHALDELRGAERRLVEANQGLQQRVDAAVQEARDLSQQVVDVQERERQRIARDLHDGVGQLITALRFELERSHADPRALDLCTRLLADTRRIVRDLIPTELEDQPLSEVLRDLVERFEGHTGLTASYRHVGGEVHDPHAAVCLLRVCQEALNNATRHARCTEVGVRLEVTPPWTTLEIFDDGQGFDPHAQRYTGTGLSSMRQRLAMLGGELHITSDPDHGTRLTARLKAG
jgi:two-component system sensor histidine kinase UhpB